MVDQSQAKCMGEEKKKRKIFLGSLERNINEQMLKEYFSKYGKVERAVVNRQHYTDISRGSGFILFESPESAFKVLEEKKPFILNNKTFYCQPCLLRNEVKEKRKELMTASYQSNSESSNAKKINVEEKKKKRREKRRTSILSMNKSNMENFASSPSERSLEEDFDVTNYVEKERNKRKLKKLNSYHNHRIEEPNSREIRIEANNIPEERKKRRQNYAKVENDLVYSPPSFTPKKDKYANKVIEVFNQKSNTQKHHAMIPERKATPCNFEFFQNQQFESNLMLFKPEPVRVPKMEHYAENLRKQDQPIINYVLNRGEYAWDVLKRKMERCQEQGFERGNHYCYESRAVF